MAAFALHIGIDYSGAQMSTSCLAGLQLGADTAGHPERITAPAAPESKRWNWTRQKIAEWLVAQARSGQRYIAGIDHGELQTVHVLLTDREPARGGSVRLCSVGLQDLCQAAAYRYGE